MKPQVLALAQSRRSAAARSLEAVAALVMALALALALMLPTMARAAPDSFADLAERVSPAVVNITTSTMVAAPGGPNPMAPEGSPFEDFFRDFLDRQNRGDGPRPRRSQALGSGFVISEDGYIVTNNHVIEGADEITIEFYSGATLPAKVVGTDPNTDIALLKVEADAPLPFVTFGDSDIVRVGDWVMAMGNPLGQGFSVSAGIVSARGRALSGSFDDYIQTDAAINRGNSGGPLFNMAGEVIGVNTAILSPNGGSIGIGFAMSSAVVTQVVDQLRQFGETRRGWLGVRIQDVTPEIAEALGLPKVAGALVTDVPDGPSARAGMQAGDVILSFDGVEVVDTRDLVRRVAATAVGKSVRVLVFRDGATQTLTVVLGRREEAEGAAAPGTGAEPPAVADVLGMTLVQITPDLRAERGLAAGVSGLLVQQVDEGSEAFAKGIRAGDVITEAGQQKLETPADLEARIAEARDAGRRSLLLLVRRDGEPRFVALSVAE